MAQDLPGYRQGLQLATGGFDLSANKLNKVHSRYPLINGNGMHISIKENYYDTNDIDLKGRLEYSPLASSVLTNHANFIATIAAGGGNSVYYAKGAAWSALISSSSFDQILPDALSYYTLNNITVQNHAYGTTIDNVYGTNAKAFDKSCNDAPGLLHVISSGNSGTSASTSGMYNGLAGWANLTGNFKMAKNPLIVGAADSFGIVTPLSSRGPTYDGRIKPEIVAFEKNGSSEAAAIVSGAALLMQQAYKDINASALPSALAKVILINGADDVGNAGPDFISGFGNMNAYKSLNIIRQNKFFSGSVSQSGTQSFIINVPAGISLLKLTLAWNDPEANLSAPKALINDLDLTLLKISTGESWKPWVLDPSPNSIALNNVAVRKRDSLNNVEQVTLQNPAAGDYHFAVNGFSILTGIQTFYIAYSADTSNRFEWMFPASGDFVEAGKETVIRWENSFALPGNIEYSVGATGVWKPISINTDLTKNYSRWSVPDTTAPCLLRVKIGTSFFYSDTFAVSRLLTPQVGFNCSDSILLYWDKIPGISNYRLFQLGTRFMEALISVQDTTIVLAKNQVSSKYFSVAPVLANGMTGARSFTFNYTTQGVGCYVKTFNADLSGNTARLTLTLGTSYNVKSIAFQKQVGAGFITLDSSSSALTSFLYNYQPLTPGYHNFRARITLWDGRIIYSDIATLFYVEAGKYLLLPVPTRKNSFIELLTAIPDGEMFSVYDGTGKKIFQQEIRFTREHIGTANMQSGSYFYRITKNGVLQASGKLLVL